MVRKDFLQQIQTETQDVRVRKQEVEQRAAARRLLIQKAKETWQTVNPANVLKQIVESSTQGSVTETEREMGLDGNYFEYELSTSAENLPLPQGVTPIEPYRDHATGKVVDGAVLFWRTGTIKISILAADAGVRINIIGGDDTTTTLNPQDEKFSDEFDTALERAWKNRVRKAFPNSADAP